MLDLFRKRGAMSVVYSALMGAVIVVFIIQFRPNSGSPMGALTRKCVAKVRGTCIDEKDWRAQRFLLRGPYEGGPQVNYNKAALDSLIERTLLEQEADRIGLRVNEDDVMNEIIRDKVYVHVPVSMRAQARQIGVNDLGFRWTTFGTKEKPFDQQVFEKVVHNTTNQNVSEFTDTQAQELRAARMLALVAERVRVSDVEAWEGYRHEKSTTSVRYVHFAPAFFAEHFATMDQASVDKWADEHKAEVDAAEAKQPKDQEKRLLHPRHILIDAKKDAPADVKAAAKKKADDLAERIRKGDDFAKLAKENSTDPGSKDKGGEYDWTSGAEYVPEFRDGLAKLKVGETAVVETQFGFHVIQILGRYDGRAAAAFPLYREAKGGELAKSAADKLGDALKALLPVKSDDPAVKAKVEEAKKGGKLEADAQAQVIEDETKARVSKAIDDTLSAMAPRPAKPKDEKPAGGAKDDKNPKPAPTPAWQTDERRPKLEESQPFANGAPPVESAPEAQPLIDAVAKLGDKDIVAVTSGNEQFVMMLKGKHEATRAEFDKEHVQYVGQLVGKKREDALVNYVTSLRESLTKDTLTIDARYEQDENKKAAPGDQPPIAPIEPEEPQ